MMYGELEMYTGWKGLKPTIWTDIIDSTNKICFPLYNFEQAPMYILVERDG